MARLNRYDIICKQNNDTITIRIVDKLREYKSVSYSIVNTISIDFDGLKSHIDDLSNDLEQIIYTDENVNDTVNEWIVKYGSPTGKS